MFIAPGVWCNSERFRNNCAGLCHCRRCFLESSSLPEFSYQRAY